MTSVSEASSSPHSISDGGAGSSSPSSGGGSSPRSSTITLLASTTLPQVGRCNAHNALNQYTLCCHIRHACVSLLLCRRMRHNCCSWRLTALAAAVPQAPGRPQRFRLAIPRLDAYFTGTGEAWGIMQRSVKQ